MTMRLFGRGRLSSRAGVLLAVGVIVVVVGGYRWSTAHVRYMTGGQPGPVNCVPCHVQTRKNTWVARLLDERYLSPLDIAVSPDGTRLYVTAQDADALIVLDPDARRVVAEIHVGRRPHTVVLDRQGARAYVSNQWSDEVTIVDLETHQILSTLQTGSGPAGMALGPEERYLYVANSFSDDISILDLREGSETRRLRAGRNPYAVGLSPDGLEIYVTNRTTNPVPYRTPPVTEVTVIDTRSQRVSGRRMFHAAHLLEGIAFTPGAEVAVVTLVKPKNLVPATQVRRGWVLTNGLGIIERGDGGRVIQVLLDEGTACFADPCDVEVTRDGRTAFVTSAGGDQVAAVDLGALRGLLAGAAPESLRIYASHLGVSSRYVVKRIPTGANPKSLALAPDGRRLYVTERLSDKVAVIDTEELEVVDRLDLGGPRRETLLRRGQRLFNSAGNTFQKQFSCRSCHPDGHEDGLSYDLEPDGLGRNILNTRSLRDLGETGPFKWNGKNVSLYMQCGIRFSKFITRSQPPEPDDLYALVAFIVRGIPHPPNRYRAASGGLTPAQARGREIFERSTTNDGRVIPVRDRCHTCHRPPHHTNRQKADVGTLAETDSRHEFDVSHLDNVYESPPYLHDGRAATLEEIWTRFNPDDEHGFANDLSKEQLNDLIEYLRTL